MLLLLVLLLLSIWLHDAVHKAYVSHNYVRHSLPVCADLCNSYNLHCGTYMASVVVDCSEREGNFRAIDDDAYCTGDHQQVNGCSVVQCCATPC